jgi:hypothetical protein
MADDNRFDGYTPAPLQQSGLDRAVRTTAGAVEGGVKYAAGGWLLWTIGVGVVATGFVVALPAIGAGIASVAGSLGLFGTVAVGVGVAAAAVAGIFGAVPAVLSGLYGAVRGGSREHARSGLDNSLYNIAASQQAAPIYYAPPPQGMTPPSPVVQSPAPVARDDMPASVAENLAQNTVAAGSPIQHDGTIDARNVSRAAG